MSSALPLRNGTTIDEPSSGGIGMRLKNASDRFTTINVAPKFMICDAAAKDMLV